MKLDIHNEVEGFIPPTQKLNQIISSLTKRPVELVITDADSIQAVNLQTRGINKATDVLSFPFIGKGKKSPLGSVMINVKAVEQKASELGHTQDEEFCLLFIHGVLHLLGYDHEVDNGEMRAKEKALIEQFHLPKSLIVRTES